MYTIWLCWLDCSRAPPRTGLGKLCIFPRVQQASSEFNSLDGIDEPHPEHWWRCSYTGPKFQSSHISRCLRTLSLTHSLTNLGSSQTPLVILSTLKLGMTNLKTNPSPRPPNNLGLLRIANEFIDLLAIYFNFFPPPPPFISTFPHFQVLVNSCSYSPANTFFFYWQILIWKIWFWPIHKGCFFIKKWLKFARFRI
jgi:hypothetical protein